MFFKCFKPSSPQRLLMTVNVDDFDYKQIIKLTKQDFSSTKAFATWLNVNIPTIQMVHDTTSIKLSISSYSGALIDDVSQDFLDSFITNLKKTNWHKDTKIILGLTTVFFTKLL